MKLTLNDLASLTSETSAVQAINNNNVAIEDAIENTLSRDGSGPNQMNADIDLNGYGLLNLKPPVNPTDAVRLQDIGGGTIPDLSQLQALAAQTTANAAVAAAAAATASGYVGAASQAPKWSTPRTITITGAVGGTSPAWDGSTNLSFSVSIPGGSIGAAQLSTTAITDRLGFTPLNRSGDVIFGEVRINYTATTLSEDAIGFRGIPVVSYDVTHTATVDDIGKMLRHNSGTAHTYWLDTTAVTPYPIGATIVVRNVGSGVVTIGRGSGVAARIAGQATDQAVSVAQWGMATCVHEANNVWVITGTGIS